MHPLTPLVRSWQVLVGLVLVAGQWTGSNAVEGGSGLLDAIGSGNFGRVLAGGGAVLLLVLAVATGLAVLSWRMSRYRVDEEALELHNGVLFRQQRRARLDRLQAVDVVQPLHRQAGRAGPARRRGGRGRQLPDHAVLPDRGAGRQPAQPPAGPGRGAALRHPGGAGGARARRWSTSRRPRLVGSLLLSGAAVATVLGLVGLLLVALVFDTFAPAVGIIPAALGLAGGDLVPVQRRLQLPGGDLAGRVAAAARPARAPQPDRAAGPGAGGPAQPAAAVAQTGLVAGPGQRRRLRRRRRRASRSAGPRCCRSAPARRLSGC